MSENVPEEPKRKKDRSPNHPSLSLETAIEKAKLLHDKYGRSPAPILLACQTIGYKTVYSTSQQAVAALKAYGLVETSGKGNARKECVTEFGERIIRNSPDREALIRKAALTPAIHAELWAHYNGALPHDDILRNYLLWDRAEGSCFTEDAVGGFIARLRDTIKFAKLTSDDKKNNENGEGEGDEEGENGGGRGDRKPIEVGAFVQWTSQGQLQFPEARKFVGASEDGEYGFVEGSPTGIPMSELSVLEPPQPLRLPASPPANPFYKPRQDDHPAVEESIGVAKNRLTLDEGALTLEYPDNLSAESVQDVDDWFRVIIRRMKRKAGVSQTKQDESDVIN